MTIAIFGSKPYKSKVLSLSNYIGNYIQRTVFNSSCSSNKLFNLYSSTCFNKSLSVKDYLGELFTSFLFKDQLGKQYSHLCIDVPLSCKSEFTSFSCSLSSEKPYSYKVPLSFNSVFDFKQQEGYHFYCLTTLPSITSMVSDLNALGMNKEKEFHSSLPFNILDNVESSCGISQELNFLEPFRGKVFGGYLFLNSLVEGLGYQSFPVKNTLANQKPFSAKDLISKGLFEDQKLSNSIDYYFGKEFSFVNEFNDVISSTLILKNSLADSISATTKVSGNISKMTKCSSNLFGQEVLSDCDVEIADSKLIPTGNIEIDVGNIPLKFLLEEISQDKKNNSTSLWGRACSAKLYEPFALKVKVSRSLGRASEIVGELLTGFDVVWDIDDFWVKNLSEEGYPLEITKRVVEAGGGILRGAPDGKIYVVYPYRKDLPQVSLNTILSATLGRKTKEADGVTVIFGGSNSSPITMEADKTQVPVGTWANVKVYSMLPYTFSSMADVFYKEQKAVTEVVDEEITMEDGQGTISKPVLEVIDAPSWADVNGQTVTSKKQCKIATVKYKTRYDLWKVTNYKEAKVLNCSVVTGNSVTILSGTGERVVKIEEPLITEASVARKRAEQELIKRRGYWQASVTVPFDESLVDYRGMPVSTPWGNGIVTGQSLSIKGPKVLLNSEVMLWHQ